MKDMVNERLILLATAQERMARVTDRLDQWDSSLHSMEKSAFDSINVSDKVLNMSKEGKNLVEQLQDCYHNPFCGMNADEKTKIEEKLDELNNLLHKIMELSFAGNEISHKMEIETVCQKEMKEDIRKSLIMVKDSIDSAVACAEFMMAEL